MSKPTIAHRWAEIFAALADPTRLRLLNLIAGHEVCVCYLVEILHLPQPTISRHLAYLRKSGLVSARREGKWMHYRLTPPNDPAAAAILSQALEALGQDSAMLADREQLERSCCAPQTLALPRGIA